MCKCQVILLIKNYQEKYVESNFHYLLNTVIWKYKKKRIIQKYNWFWSVPFFFFLPRVIGFSAPLIIGSLLNHCTKAFPFLIQPFVGFIDEFKKWHCRPKRSFEWFRIFYPSRNSMFLPQAIYVPVWKKCPTSTLVGFIFH